MSDKRERDNLIFGQQMEAHQRETMNHVRKNFSPSEWKGFHKTAEERAKERAKLTSAPWITPEDFGRGIVNGVSDSFIVDKTDSHEEDFSIFL